MHEATYELETIARQQATVAVPACVLGTPISGTGTPLDGINQVNNMPLFEVEDAALADLQNWLVSGVQPPHGRPISTIPVFFGLYDIVNADRYGIGLGGIRVPEAQVPVEDYSPINFAQTNSSNLNPIALLSEAQSALAALSTGSINNSAVRSAGLCLLSGYFLDLPHPTLQALYPTLSNYVSKYTAAADAEVASRFLTPADAAAAIANAQAGHGPSQTPASTIP